MIFLSGCKTKVQGQQADENKRDSPAEIEAHHDPRREECNVCMMRMLCRMNVVHNGMKGLLADL